MVIDFFAVSYSKTALIVPQNCRLKKEVKFTLKELDFVNEFAMIYLVFSPFIPYIAILGDELQLRSYLNFPEI